MVCIRRVICKSRGRTKARPNDFQTGASVSRESALKPEPDIYELYDQKFTNPTLKINSKPFVQATREILQATGFDPTPFFRSDIDYFLDADEETQLPPSLRETIRKLVGPGIISTGRYQSDYTLSETGNSKGWVDERACNKSDHSKTYRCHQNPVAASVLRQALLRKRWREEGEPDADRRLVFVVPSYSMNFR
jgi:hypothetical protein